MLKSMVIASLMMFGLSSQAELTPNVMMKSIVDVTVQDLQPMALLNWNVGSTADYRLAGGIISGTMHTQVREETSLGYWVQQDMDLGFMGSQKVEIHYNKETAEVIELLVNGEKQSLPDPNSMEMVENRREQVTVPAGQFESMYIKLKEKDKAEVTEIWVNPGIVPMGGMIKTIAPSPMGAITIELTAFKL